MTKKNHKVIVITLNYNQNKYTIDCIQSILNSEYSNINILIIDNGSTLNNYHELLLEIDKINDSRIILKRINENIGYVGGINYGLKEGLKLIPNYFLIMNNDTVIHKESISELVSVCQKYSNYAIVSGKVYWYDNPNLIQNAGIKFSKFNKNPKPIGLNMYDPIQNDKIAYRDMLDDIYWLFPVALIDKIGFYSDDFWFNYEQADFAMKAKKAGYKLIYTPFAKLWHKSGVSIGGRINNPIKTYYNTQSLLIYMYKNFNIFLFLFTYIKIWVRLAKYCFLIPLGKFSIKQIYATLGGIIYFHKWVVIRNKNSGKIPAIIHNHMSKKIVSTDKSILNNM